MSRQSDLIVNLNKNKGYNVFEVLKEEDIIDDCTFYFMIDSVQTKDCLDYEIIGSYYYLLGTQCKDRQLNCNLVGASEFHQSNLFGTDKKTLIITNFVIQCKKEEYVNNLKIKEIEEVSFEHQ